MADIAHEWTEDQIKQLQKDFRKTYSTAAREMRTKLVKFMKDFDRENKEWKKRVKNQPSLQKEYKQWLKSKAADRGWIMSMVRTITADATRADQIAAEHIYDTVPYVFAENANRAAFAIQRGIGREIGEFSMYDVDTVRNLIANSPQLLPPLIDTSKNYSRSKDIIWNSSKFSNEITQAILQGESIPHTQERLMRVLHMDERAATRSARTAMTCAENAGRIHSYQRAKNLGISMKQEWVATLSERTRVEHRILDGQRVEVGEKFEVNGKTIEFPGDPKASPELVWNCRCTLAAYFEDVQDPERWSELPEDMTYEEWKYGKGKSTGNQHKKNA